MVAVLEMVVRLNHNENGRLRGGMGYGCSEMRKTEVEKADDMSGRPTIRTITAHGPLVAVSKIYRRKHAENADFSIRLELLG